MSDRPSQIDNIPDEPEFEGGWRQPEAPGEWRAPESTDKTEDADLWRTPTLPKDLDVTPQNEGVWHLPKPEDTVLTPEDESLIAAEAAEADTEVKTDALEVLPFEGTGQPDAEALSLDLFDDDDDDVDSFSMSELVALASLVDAAPAVEVQRAQAEEEQAADEAQEAAPEDPAEYARRQLELLASKAEAEVEASAPHAVEEAPEEAQPAESEAPEGAAEPLTPEQEALARKFREAETRIRALRDRFKAGEITRDQLQSELRGQMVLDNEQVWWMMGVETDTWYRFENGQWVAATPPMSGDKSGPSVAGSLPYLSDQQPAAPGESVGDATIAGTPAVALGEDDMPLPRQVPVHDPDYTVPGTKGIYLPPVEAGSATVPMSASQDTIASAPYSEATVPGAAVQGDYNYVAAPGVDEPPSYDVGASSQAYEDAVRRQRQSTIRTLGILAAVGAGILFIMGACGIIAGVAYYESLLSPWRDEIGALANYQPNFRTARILAADGSVIAELTSRQGGARDTIALEDISPYMIHAIISTENERFYDDPGWDPIAIGRAFIQNVIAGGIESGASTITQQIARNLILQDTTVSAERKLQEVVVASEIARQYDKNFILELYLNEFFFGNQSYGVEAASQFYYNHTAADLNLPEAALLAGILQAPARYDPVINRQASFDRMNVVLSLMQEVGCLQFQHAPYLGQPFCITPQVVSSGEVVLQKAQLETANYSPREVRIRYPHFVNYIQSQIEQYFGTDEMFRRGFEIRTTLVPRIQDTAQDALVRQIQALVNNGVNTGAVIATDPRNGAILAMVGSPNFNDQEIDGQVNNVFTWQQPGSAIKPVVYTAALEGFSVNGTPTYFTPATILWDVPVTYPTTPPYSPVNYDRTFHGPTALRFALANSYNVPAVKTYAAIGAQRFQETAGRMGLRFLDEAQFGLATALGADEVRLYDMAQAFGTLANNGVRVPTFGIVGITDASGAEVPLPERTGPVQAVQPQIAYLMQSILSDNEARSAAFGLNSGLALPAYPGLVGAKTGTSNDSRDLWTMGFTRGAVVGVWIGRVDNNPTVNTSGLAAVPIWNTVMQAVLQGTSPEPFTNPGGVVEQQICGDTGTIYDPNVTQNCTAVRTELFLVNQPPPPASQAFIQTVPVDTWTNLRANQYCPDHIRTGTFATIDDASAIQWLNTPQGAAYAQQLGLTTPIEPLPAGECSPSTVQPQVRITSPTDAQQVTGVVQVLGTVTANNMNRYQIEVASINQPENFTLVYGPSAAQQPNGVLGEWNTTSFPNGVYRVRLAVFANDGGYIYKTVQIGVNNIPPTDIPLPTAIVPTPDFGSTTIPFDTPIPAGSLNSGPSTMIPLGGLSNLATPTATVDFGG